jgi:hypothetical protein
MPKPLLVATPHVIDTLNKMDSYVKKESNLVQDIHAQPTEEPIINLDIKGLVPVRVITGDGVAGYICDIFENGLTEPATKQGRVFLANGNSTIYTLPAGTVMYAQPAKISRQGSNN